MCSDVGGPTHLTRKTAAQRAKVVAYNDKKSFPNKHLSYLRQCRQFWRVQLKNERGDGDGGGVTIPEKQFPRGKTTAHPVTGT